MDINVIDYSELLDDLATGLYDNLEENTQNANDNRDDIVTNYVGDVGNNSMQQQFEHFSGLLDVQSVDDIARFFDINTNEPGSDSLELIDKKAMELYLTNCYLHDCLVDDGTSFDNEIDFLNYRKSSQAVTLKTTNYGRYLRNNIAIKNLKNILSSICSHKLEIFSLQAGLEINVETPVYNKNFPSEYWEELVKFIRLKRFNRSGKHIVQNVPGTTTWKPYIRNNERVEIKGMVTCFEEYKLNTDKEFYNMYIDPSNHAKFSQLLEKTNNRQFQEVEYSRFAFQFKNGVYIANSIQLPSDYLVGDVEIRNIPIKDKTGQFIPKSDPNYNTSCITTFTSGCSEYDFDDSHYNHWSEIETPYLERILDYQKLDSEVKKWFYIMLGRLLYPVALFDNWELVLFLYGEPGCGKSRILATIASIIGNQHVGAVTAGNSIDFILGDSRQKRFLLIDEVKDDFVIKASMFQQMASGTTISSYKKFQDQVVGTWRVAMGMAGNDKLPFRDEDTDSIIRRLFLIEFPYAYNEIPGVEPVNLEANLPKEAPKILRKINEAYLEAAHQLKGHKVHNFMPAYFKEVLNLYTTNNNYLADTFKTLLDPAVGAFVNSENEADYITFRHFQQACKVQNITLRRLSKEKAFLNIMNKMNYTVVVVGDESRVTNIRATFDL